MPCAAAGVEVAVEAAGAVGAALAVPPEGAGVAVAAGGWLGDAAGVVATGAAGVVEAASVPLGAWPPAICNKSLMAMG